MKYLEIRSRRHLGDALPCGTHKVSVTLALPSDPDVLWKTFKTGHRQDIRRAYKNGFVAQFGGADLLDPFYEVMSESWRNLGTPLYNRHYFRKVVETFPGSTRVCVVFDGNEPAAAAFDGIHGDTIEGMWMGAKAKYRDRLVSYVLYWELIKQAAESGARPLPFRPFDRRFRQRDLQEEVERVGRRSCTGITFCPPGRRCRP